MPAPFRYTSHDEDSARWTGFPLRDGDIVISTRSKTGTTWVQMICALLVFGGPELPAPLTQLSPWMDELTRPREEVWARLAAQRHRRFIKTHTPLDGLPLDPRARYIVTARHPLDAIVSGCHQSDNINRERQRELIGTQPQAAQPPAAPEPARPPRSVHDRVVAWIDRDADPRADPDSLQNVMWHLSDAWARRHEPNVLLVRYEELCADLAGQMRRIAGWLGIGVPEAAWPELVAAAGFASMAGRAAELSPQAGTGVFKSDAAFFRRGSPGAAAELLTAAELERYHERAAALAPPDLLRWLHAPAGAERG